MRADIRLATVWLTGLSGAGKSTIASTASRLLDSQGVRTALLDGDVLRGGLNAGLGFDRDARAEAVRRAGEAACLLARAGVVPVVALISPYAADRDRVRARHAAEGVGFLEVFVDAPLRVLESRDPKGLYARARAGQLQGFTGIDDPYEPPARPELHLHTDRCSAEDCVNQVVDAIKRAIRAG